MVNHAREYVRGKVHTNTLENSWSLLKRAIKGTYVSVDPFHLSQYVDEQVFRYNLRKGSDGGRLADARRGIVGKRLTYADLTSMKLTFATTQKEVVAAQATRPKGEPMKKKPEPPVIAGSPEEALERMRALTRRVLATPKGRKAKTKKRRRH